MLNEEIGILRALSQIEKNEVYSTDEVLKAICQDNMQVEIVFPDTEFEEEIEKGLKSPVSLLGHKEVFQSFRSQYTKAKIE
jgi:hypothetical protein